MTILYFYCFVIVLCFLLSAFFASSETALLSLKKPDLHRFSVSQSGNVEKQIYKTMKEPQSILITVLIGSTIANMVATSVSTQLLLMKWPVFGHFISAFAVTLAIMLFCEIFPKIIAVNAYETVAKKTYRILKLFHWLFLPVRFIILLLVNHIIKLFNLKLFSDSFSSDELGQAVRSGEADGVINKKESVFIQNVLIFSKKEAANVMFPRNRAVFLHDKATVKEAMELFLKYDFVRIPVYRKNYDHITGYIDSKDIISSYLWRGKEKSIKKFIHPIAFYPSTKELHELLSDMIASRSQIAVLVDEYGGVDGVVTLNRILSELMGKGLSKWKERDFEVKRISGDMQMSDYNFEFNDMIESDDSDTIGGYIIEKLGRFPKKGESVKTRFYELNVRSVEKNRVVSVEVTKNGR
ncbi:MAG: hemolysin family protein [Leptospirales bacterium]|nr:hemolysin family protein [Leptospirales bacterium]